MVTKLIFLVVYWVFAQANTQTKGAEDANQEIQSIPRQPRIFLTPVIHWAQWESWSNSQCSKPCGGGYKHRHRQCLFENNTPTAAKYCEVLFYRPSTQSQYCNGQACSAPHWSTWYTWSSCSQSCGKGVRNRSRYCRKYQWQPNCQGSKFDFESCSHTCTSPSTSTTKPTTQSTTTTTTVVTTRIPDPHWSTWYMWTACSQSCGSGYRYRSRYCRKTYQWQPNCQGSDTDYEFCSHTCTSPSTSTTKPTTTQSTTTSTTVVTSHIPAPHWSTWYTWTTCSQSCGSGIRYRSRYCRKTYQGQPSCQGSDTDYEYCSHTCTIHSTSTTKPTTTQSTTTSTTVMTTSHIPAPHWSTWYTWTSCSQSCGIGVRHRSRYCRKTYQWQPTCQGHSTMVEVCSQSCTSPSTPTTKPTTKGPSTPTTKPTTLPTTKSTTKLATSHIPDRDGMWSYWGSWSTCSHSCGQGIQYRKRSCDNPSPSGRGHVCYGDSAQNRACLMADCAVMGWSKWGMWSSCSGTCGSGIQLRVRTCSHPNSGLCPGGSTETQLCAHPRSCQGSYVYSTSTTPQKTTTVKQSTTSKQTTTSSTLPPATTPSTVLTTSTTTATNASPSTSSVSMPPITTSASSCSDNAICSDPKTKAVACKDAYVAASYCPKMCGLCV